MKTDRPVATGEAPAASPKPVAWQYRRRSILPGGGWWGWMECLEADTIAYASDADKETRALYAEPTPNSETGKDLPTMASLWGAVPDHPGVSDDVAETRALLEALEPLAKVADLISDDNIGDDTGLWARSSNMPGESYTLTVGHARRARTAIDQARGD